MTIRRFVLIISLVLTGCAPSQAQLAATAKVAIQQTQTAMPTKTLIPPTEIPTQTPAPVQFPAPALGIGSSKVRPADSMEMMYIPEGEFTMGYGNGLLDERPTHKVSLDAFWFDKSEVTTGQYSLCVGAGNCKQLRSSQPFQDLPVINAEWRDANAYCSYVGARLPTEAEWEKAGARN